MWSPLWVWESEIPENICDQIINCSLEEEYFEGVTSRGIEKGRKVDIKFLYDKYNWINALMLGYALFANGENFKYELSMSDIESVQLSHYKKGQFYSKHVDFNNFNSNNAFTRKLSMSIQLSHENSYEGGDLLLYYSGDVYRTPKSKGSVIVFDSRLTHEVTPITKGERYSLVKWDNGDKPLA